MKIGPEADIAIEEAFRATKEAKRLMGEAFIALKSEGRLAEAQLAMEAADTIVAAMMRMP
jgi:hypothetical protein